MKKAGVTEVPAENAKAVEAILKDATASKSGKMKALFDLGFEVNQIKDMTGVSFNFVYNVISNYVRVNRIDVETKEKTGKKEQIIAMYLAGKTNKEIQIDLATNYNYVFNVIKQYKASQGQATTAVVSTEQPAAGE